MDSSVHKPVINGPLELFLQRPCTYNTELVSLNTMQNHNNILAMKIWASIQWTDL